MLLRFFDTVGSNGIARGFLLIDAAGDHHVPFKRLCFRVPLLILHWPRGRNALQIHQQIAAMRPDKNTESWNSALLWYDGWMVRQGPTMSGLFAIRYAVTLSGWPDALTAPCGSLHSLSIRLASLQARAPELWQKAGDRPAGR